MTDRPAHGVSRRKLPASALLGGCLALALLITGCEGGDKEASPAGGAGGSSDPVHSATSSPADGTNIAACSDGNCEVAVTAPVDIRLTGHGGLTKLSITEVTREGVRFNTTSKTGSGSGAVEVGCISTFYPNGAGSRCSSGQLPKPSKEKGVLKLQVVTVVDETATIRLVSGEPGRPDPSRYPQPPTIELPDLG